MGNTVCKLNAKFYRATLIKKRSNGRHTPVSKPKNGKVQKDSKTKKNSLKYKKFRSFSKINSGEHCLEAACIRKGFKIGVTKSLTKKQNILFLERF